MISSIFCWTACVVLASGDAQPANASAGAGEETARSSVAQLVDQLGSPDYAQRHQATQQLKSMDKSFTEELKTVMLRVQDHEVRLRVQEIAEHLFYRDVMKQLGGFLGIQLRAVDRAQEPNLGPVSAAIRIEAVLPDTAAQRAGLRVGDLVVEVDGSEVNVTRDDHRPFVELISGKPPGTAVQLVILRGQELLETTAVLGFKKLDMDSVVVPSQHVEALKQAQLEYNRWCRQVRPLR